MTPDEQAKFNKMQGDLQDAISTINELSDTLNTLVDLYYRNAMVDKFAFDKDVYVAGSLSVSRNFNINDGQNIVLGTTTGTKIGTDPLQKIGFFGKTPIGRQGTISSPAAPGVAYSQAEAQSTVTTVNSLITLLQAFGFIA